MSSAERHIILSFNGKSLPEPYRHQGPLNVPTRFNCPNCNPKDEGAHLYVTRTVLSSGVLGWLHHCHKCAPAMSGFTSASGKMSPKQTDQAYSEAAKETINKDTKLTQFPADISWYQEDWPKKPRRWMMKYGILEDELRRFGIGWSFSRSSLILPVYPNDDSPVPTVWWERTFENKGPKYIKRYTTESEDHETTLLEIYNGVDVILVEDMISAIKVGRYASVICLHGSNLTDEVIYRCTKYENAFVWLDPDKFKESIKMARRLNALGVSATWISTPCDPKELNDEEILDAIIKGIDLLDNQKELAAN